jgi:hypothetical protein
MPEFCDAGLRSLLIGALEEVLLFLGGLAAFVPVLGPWPLMPCAKAAPVAAARMAAAVIAILNFIGVSRFRVISRRCGLLYEPAASPLVPRRKSLVRHFR